MSAPTVLNRLETLRQFVTNWPIIKDKKLAYESQVVTVTATAITIKNGLVIVDAGSAMASTLAAPISGTDDGAEIEVRSATAQAHTVTLPSGHGTINGASNIATFGGAIGDGFVWVAYQGKWLQKSATNIVLSGS